MDPVTISSLITILARYGPAAYEAAVGLFSKTEVTQEDLRALLPLVQTTMDDRLNRERARREASGVNAASVK